MDTIETVPPEIYLDDTEKFTDNDGNIIEIQVVGERDVNKCFFKVKDIMNGFGLNNLHKTIIDKRKDGYIENTHYKYFYSANFVQDENGRLKKLYLTYKGLLRVLFASNKKTADKFVDWASKVVFTAQLGTENQKQELVSNLMGVSVDAVKEVFNKNACSIPCIYLFSLGKVSDLRKQLKIHKSFDDDDFVYKWGMTIDLTRRTQEHETTYGKMKNVTLELVTFGFIDPMNVSKAETDVKNLFIEMNYKLQHDKHIELAIIPNNKVKFIKKQYGNISKIYMGHIVELLNKIKEKIKKSLSQKKNINPNSKRINFFSKKKKMNYSEKS